MYHIFFIYLFVSGHWGICILFELWFSPDICLGMGLLDHMVLLIVF